VDDAAQQGLAAAAGRSQQLVGVVEHLVRATRGGPCATGAGGSRVRACECVCVPQCVRVCGLCRPTCCASRRCAAGRAQHATHTTTQQRTSRTAFMFQLPRAVSLCASSGSCTDRKKELPPLPLPFPPKRRCGASKPRAALL
jgi:hypothetical protein